MTKAGKVIRLGSQGSIMWAEEGGVLVQIPCNPEATLIGPARRVAVPTLQMMLNAEHAKKKTKPKRPKQPLEEN